MLLSRRLKMTRKCCFSMVADCCKRSFGHKDDFESRDGRSLIPWVLLWDALLMLF